MEITGVGKLINSLRHQPGAIGEKAKILVNKWKQMVSEEEEAEERRRELLKKVNDEQPNNQSQVRRIRLTITIT